ncbi:sugar phosphate isomerase/epimerase family protein [Flavihumibacter fluvii]|uniref:sugar phosphate isomerase/epimerase family protein n=1 Tax=Flavihumibacter fluvii TaxID=2838157 RepID=UPI001BDE9B5B|nr:sugar phosphate isomerase/epimerase [Flavihumibacter fluvii]ULQ52940.1 sugar phosphate isomerase/epimerase [Flavihumibacter fluvii]
MISRRKFLQNNSTIALGAFLLPTMDFGNDYIKNPGLQLYSVRKEMLEAPIPTLQKLSAMGIKQLESASSNKGHYYGLTPQEIRNIAKDLGMTVRSGHVQLDKNWAKTLEEAAAAGQEYIIVSSLPSEGQTIDNYKKVAEQFNDAGVEAKKLGLRFGYHNHDFEFEKENDTVLYDILLEETEPTFVCMELDLGWVVATGNDPLAYFKKYPGRFPLWHLKDMDLKKKISTEFGKGGLNIKSMFANATQSGLRYFFIEQEEYSVNAFESIQYDLNFLKSI